MARPVPDEIPMRPDYGRGSYRRCIVLETVGDGVRGELADDFHHFAVTVEHDGRAVTAARGEGIRVPWTTCPGAIPALRALVGAPLSDSFLETLRYADPRAQCTHLYDLACLAVCHARRAQEGGAGRRRYDVTLPDRRSGGSRPTLLRDGELVLDWQILGSEIAEATPEVFAGLSLGGTPFHRFVMRELDADLAEAALVMRRAIFIGLGRRYAFDGMSEARMFAPVVGAACHTFDEARVGEAKRVLGTVRDFHDQPERILERDGDH